MSIVYSEDVGPCYDEHYFECLQYIQARGGLNPDANKSVYPLIIRISGYMVTLACITVTWIYLHLHNNKECDDFTKWSEALIILGFIGVLFGGFNIVFEELCAGQTGACICIKFTSVWGMGLGLAFIISASLEATSEERRRHPLIVIGVAFGIVAGLMSLIHALLLQVQYCICCCLCWLLGLSVYHGGWKSLSVAEGYLEDSIQNKIEIADKIQGKQSSSSVDVGLEQKQQSAKQSSSCVGGTIDLNF